MDRPLNGRGFTLIETVLALSLLATLTYLASFSLMGLAAKYHLEKAVWDVRAALSAARARAILDETRFRVRFWPDHVLLERYDEAAGAWRSDASTWIEDAVIEANNAPVFSPEGTVANLATIIVSNSWSGYKLTLAITGRIKTVRLPS